MMKKYLKNRVVIIASLLIVFAVFNLLLSYSYYIATVINNESSTTISLKSSGVTIVYENNSGYLATEDLAPGSKISKQFSISSNIKTGDIQNDTSKIWYNIRLVIEENTFSDNAINCSLNVDESSSDTGKYATEFTSKGILSGTNVGGMTLGTGYIAYGNNTHVYNLTLEYPVSETYETDRTLRAYVIVEVVNTINLNIDLNGGTFPSGTSTNAIYGKNSIVMLETPVRDNYEFAGWEVVSGDAIINGSEITLGNTTASIKALWNALIPPAGSFATDDWSTIAYYAAHPENDASPYNVGDTREIVLNGFTNTETGSNGLYTIRIANNSNYNCSLESKTACGFVVEFEDIITNYNMNSSITNEGGWPATAMRKYVNEDIYNALPQEIKDVIIQTDVVSGHGAGDKNTSREDGNWTSQDKLYLLSAREIYANCTGGTNNAAGCWDYASLNTITRQLDYYANKGVTTSSYSGTIKKLKNSATGWWLRSAYSSDYNSFRIVNTNGKSHYNYANNTDGVAPAFRIG